MRGKATYYLAIATLVRTQNPISEGRHEAPPLAYWVLAFPIENDYSYNRPLAELKINPEQRKF